MRSKSTSVVSALFVLLASFSVTGYSQEEISRRTVKSFDVVGVSRIDAALSLAKLQQFPLGIEYAGPKLFELITVHVGSSDIGTIMGDLFPSTAGFRILTQNGVLVVTDQAPPQNRLNILDVRLSHFSIPRCSVQEAYVLLMNQLRRQLAPPHQERGIAGSISGEGSTKIGPFALTDVTVRTALDRIVFERKDAAWIVQVRPELLVQTNDRDLEKMFSDGNLAPWTIVEYDSSLMRNIGKMVESHVSSTAMELK